MKLVIIYYHEIVDSHGYSYQKKDIGNFEMEMRYLFEHRDKYKIISFKDFLNGNYSLSKTNLIISFDDGFRSVLENAHPILEKYGFPYSIYLATSYVDKDSFLSLKDIVFLKRSGLVEFEAHTHNHIDCKRAPLSKIEDEINLSNEYFQTHIGEKPNVFCYPYGKFSLKTQKFFLKNDFYDLMLGSFYGTIKKRSKRTLPRVGISNNDSLKTFVRKIDGKLNFKGKLQKLRTILFKNY